MPAGTLALASPPQAAGAVALSLPEIFEVHFDFVWRSVRRFGVPEAGADDAVQEVFLVAMRKLAQIEPGREKSFLFGTAIRVASGVRRAALRRRDRVAEDDDVGAHAVSTAPGQEAQLDQQRARAMLDRCIDGLPDELRAVFVLFELEGMTAAAIADLMELRPGTVASRLRRARELFRAEVARLARAEEARHG